MLNDQMVGAGTIEENRVGFVVMHSMRLKIKLGVGGGGRHKTIMVVAGTAERIMQLTPVH